MENKILQLLKFSDAERLVILGDLKHNIPGISWQEHAQIPQFIKDISEHTEVVLVKGNHDGNLEKLLPNVKIWRRFSIGGALLIHGHIMEHQLDYKYIIMGHNHPCIEFRDEFGYGIRESAWIKARFKRSFSKSCKLKRNPEIVIMPAFNDMLSGMPFNIHQKSLVGPFFRRGLIELKNARIYLLDGTFLGELKDINKITI